VLNEFPYPSSERPHFYLLTYSGVRLLELDAEAVSSPTSPFGMLLGRGQDVSSTLQMLLTAHSAGEPTDSAPANSTNLNAASKTMPANASPGFFGWLKGIFSRLFGSQAQPASAHSAGPGLRAMMLSQPAERFGVEPSAEFPRVYAILIDLPMSRGEIATVFAAATGDASLYTTGTFGIIGGGGHATVRMAAKRAVQAADRFHGAAKSVTEFPYPPPDKVYYYLLTFSGVRLLEDEAPNGNRGPNATAELFRLGQEVLSQLRLTTGE
jgi:hypothetical protein